MSLVQVTCLPSMETGCACLTHSGHVEIEKKTFSLIQGRVDILIQSKSLNQTFHNPHMITHGLKSSFTIKEQKCVFSVFLTKIRVSSCAHPEESMSEAYLVFV